MSVTLAIIGSRGIGEPFKMSDRGYPGTELHTFFRNVGQFNFAIRELNAVSLRIQELERETNPEFKSAVDLDVIIGDADGADEIGRLWAKINHLDCVVKAAKWRVYGKSAGYRRNPSIIKPAKYVVALWDGESSGTAAGIDLARKLEKKLKVIRYLKKVPYLTRKARI